MISIHYINIYNHIYSLNIKLNETEWESLLVEIYLKFTILDKNFNYLMSYLIILVIHLLFIVTTYYYCALKSK